MLTLDINSKYLVLDSDASIRVIVRNPVCNFEKLVNFGAVNGSLPFCDINRSILGNPGQYDNYTSVGDRKFTGATLAFNGAEIITGTLVVKKTSDSYSFWLQSDLGAMGEEQQEKDITEMAWPENQTFYHRNIEDYDDDNDDYGITLVHNRNFWEGKGRETTKDISYIDTNGVTQFHDETRSAFGFDMWKNYNAIVNNYTYNSYLPGCVVSPFLHLRYVIKESLRMNQWFIDRNDMTEGYYDMTFLKDIKIYNNFNIIQINPATSSTEVITWDEEGNQMLAENAEVVTERTWVMGQFNYADLLPKKTYKEFLLGLQNNLNYIFFFRKHNKVDIIDRNQVLEGTPIDLNTYWLGKWEIEEELNLRLKFLPEYDENDDKFGSDFTDLSDRWDDFGEAVDTKADLLAIAAPEFGELRLVKELNQVFEYGYKVISQQNIVKHEDQVDALGWEFASTGLQPFVYGNGEEEEEIKTSFSTLQQTGTYMPLTVQRGNINSMRSLWNDFTLRLLSGNNVLFGETLYWDGDQGLFKQRWENFASFWKTRQPVATKFQLPMNMIVHVMENITGKFSTIDGEFIIEEMQIEFGLHSIDKTEITGYKV